MRKSIVTILGPTDPVHDLTTVEDVNFALGLESNTANDGITAAQITTASRLIADECNAGPDKMRTFGLLTLEESFRVEWIEPIHVLYLRQYPIQELFSVTQLGNEVDATLYDVDDEAGLLRMKQPGFGWWRGDWCGDVVVNYSGGYDLPTECPPALAQACIELIAVKRRLAMSSQHDPSVREVQHGDSRVMYFDYATSKGGVGAFPDSVTDLIEPYERYTV